jgi:hypothetical protein
VWHRNWPKNLRLSKHTDMTIHWKAENVRTGNRTRDLRVDRHLNFPLRHSDSPNIYLTLLWLQPHFEAQRSWTYLACESYITNKLVEVLGRCPLSIAFLLLLYIGVHMFLLHFQMSHWAHLLPLACVEIHLEQIWRECFHQALVCFVIEYFLLCLQCSPH